MTEFEDRMKARRAWLKIDGRENFEVPKEFAGEALSPEDVDAIKWAELAEYSLENDDAMSAFWWLRGFLEQHKVASDFDNLDALADALLDGLK